MLLYSLVLVMVGLVPQVMLQDVDCSVFKQAACPLSETNIVGYDVDVQETHQCQQR